MRAVWFREPLTSTSRLPTAIVSGHDAGRAPIEDSESALSPHVSVALRLTAIALLLRPMGPWFVRPAILAAAVLMLIFPRALRQPLVWASVAVAIAIRILADW